MARYNTVSLTNVNISTTTTIATPTQGVVTQFTGTGGYTVTLPDPRAFPGSNFNLYNASSGIITISTPSGAFIGNGATGTSTQTILTLTSFDISSDGTNWFTVGLNNNLGVQATTLTASSTVTLSPASANVAISPSGTGTVTVSPAGILTIGTSGITTTVSGNVSAVGTNQTIIMSPIGTGTVTISPVGALTINPTAVSAIDNVIIGANTAQTAAFTSATSSTNTPATPNASGTTLARKDYVDLQHAKAFYYSFIQN